MVDYKKYGIRHTPTDEQISILQKVHKNPDTNIIISAVAGGSKTTTLMMIANMLIDINHEWDNNERPLLHAVTFSRALANELIEQVPENVTATTIHSLGNSLLEQWCRENKVKWQRRKKDNGTDEYEVVKADENKYKRLIWQALEEEYDGSIAKGTISGQDRTEFFASLGSVQDIIELVQLNFIDITNHNEILSACRKFGVDVTHEDVTTAINVLQAGIAQFKNHGRRSFTEMVWLPVYLGLKSDNVNPKYIIWDEVQDASIAYMKCIELFISDDTQLIMCGDERQSIYTFSYVPTDSFSVVQEYFDAQQISMTWTFRCPSSHVKLIQQLQLKDDFHCPPWAQEGTVSSISYPRFLMDVSEGDLVLNRFNTAVDCAYPLPKVGIEVLELGKRVRYNKWDVVGFLRPMLNAMSKFKGFSIPKVESYSQIWLKYVTKQELGNAIPSKAKLNEFINIHNTFTLYWKHYVKFNTKHSIDGFLRYIEEMHNDRENAITLSSIHAAKGLQKDRVFILDSNLIPYAKLGPNSTIDDVQCELNLAYVALTRATTDLIFVDTPIPVSMPSLQQLKMRSTLKGMLSI